MCVDIVHFDSSDVPPLGSGPYEVSGHDAGRSVIYRRDPGYWARDLPVSLGRNNFDWISYDYFLDGTTEIQGPIAGLYDLKIENSAKTWATGYDSPVLRSGALVKLHLRDRTTKGMQGFAFNLRRPLFGDKRVREALTLALNFEWMNEVLFYGAYKRCESYFSESPFAARGKPSTDELAVLEPLRAEIAPEVFGDVYAPPDGSNHRADLLHALGLLREAGWHVDRDQLMDAVGHVFRFEILLRDPAFERVALSYARSLKRLGIEARVQTVHSAEYQYRTDHFDYDMVVSTFPVASLPDARLVGYWGSQAAATDGSWNLVGLRDPAVDTLLQGVLQAPDQQRLTAATRRSIACSCGTSWSCRTGTRINSGWCSGTGLAGHRRSHCTNTRSIPGGTRQTRQ